ncbi:T9SS type B sorting domain-containing protein [Cognatitamlana onchidii]|uniref:T9SS type B sorting domain-containing protein n=1 Tax=Cognatitamlana onchidii TaxID=2562860 RepID=UPI0010A6B3C0|nr:gliding motility-associated C-terminal domain-containing protein [Algibacter onchidii]
MFSKVYIKLLFILCFVNISVAQIVIGKPNLEFSQACASPSFNTYNVRFSFSPDSSVSTTNQFIIELSDSSGSFSESEVIYTSAAGSITTSPATITFAFPSTVSGESYKIRIKSTAPVATSTSSDAFPAYFKLQDTPFSINNLVSTASYCTDGSYLLTIDNPGGPTNDSPLKYPSLTYRWFRETSPTTADFVADGASLSVSTPGTYFVETNYGTCTSNSFSNRVTVSEIASGGGSSNITSSLGNPFCASEGPTSLSTVNGISYQWYKEGIEIPEATEQVYETNEDGEYSVVVDLGGCTTSASIVLDNGRFESTIDALEDNVLDEGETFLVTVTTEAINPEYKWYLNEKEISGATTASYMVSEIGNYMVAVTQTSGCELTTQSFFKVSEAFPNVENIPNIISPNGDGINDTWVIPKVYVNNSETEVLILNSQGKIELRTNNYQNNWPENAIDFNSVNPLFYYVITVEGGQTKKGTITVFK